MAILNGDYREFRLPNGLIVAMQNTPTQTIAAKLKVNFSTYHERSGEEGIAHFLEHCVATGGSQKYDPLKADQIRGLFGDFKAFTSIGRITFATNMLREDFESWADYTSNHVFNPGLDEGRVDGERKRVLREISDARSKPGYSAMRECNELFYRGHPKGLIISGKEEVIRDATVSKVREFHSRGFHPNNMDLILVGGLPPNAEEIITTYFGAPPAGENTRRKFPGLEPLKEKIIVRRPAPERCIADNPDDSSAKLQISHIGPLFSHPDSYSVAAMNCIYGRSDANSKLFQNIGLKKGLAYRASSSYEWDYNAGELSTFAEVPAKRIDEAVDAIFAEMELMKNQRVEDYTLTRTKRLIIFQATICSESNEGHANIIETRLDDGVTPEECIEGFNKVTPKSIMEVANKYLPDRENGKYLLYIRDPLMK